MRRFEFVDGKSNKFWEAKTEGPKLMVRFGRIGGTWQESDKLLADAEKANAEMEKLISEKTRKGYLEVGGKPEVKVLAKAVAKKGKTKEPKPQSMEATISPAERKAKAQKVLLMFANGQWELAHNILETAQDEEWLFEQLLNGCKIEKGEPIPSNAIKKTFKKDEKSSPVLAMLNIMLCIPDGSKLLKTFKFEKLKEDLILDGLISLSDGAAKALSKCKGKLYLRGLDSLSDSVAEALRNCKGDLDLSELKSVGDGAAQSLSKHEGELNLGGLTSLSDSPGHIALAGKLASQKVGLQLKSLVSLSDGAAKALSKYKGPLLFYRLSSLSDAAAEALSKHKGHLGLNGLKILSDSSGHIALAKKLASQKDWLLLNGLTNLSDTVAEALSKHKGDLNLNGLTSLTAAAAEALSKHKGKLDLSELKSLSNGVAEALSKHKGNMNLGGLTSLSTAAAEALSKHQGGLDFPNTNEGDTLRSKVENYRYQGDKK
jgi:predicted DNA-binding WGR domain protein